MKLLKSLSIFFLLISSLSTLPSVAQSHNDEFKSSPPPKKDFFFKAFIHTQPSYSQLNQQLQELKKEIYKIASSQKELLTVSAMFDHLVNLRLGTLKIDGISKSVHDSFISSEEGKLFEIEYHIPEWFIEDWKTEYPIEQEKIEKLFPLIHQLRCTFASIFFKMKFNRVVNATVRNNTIRYYLRTFILADITTKYLFYKGFSLKKMNLFTQGVRSSQHFKGINFQGIRTYSQYLSHLRSIITDYLLKTKSHRKIEDLVALSHKEQKKIINNAVLKFTEPLPKLSHTFLKIILNSRPAEKLSFELYLALNWPGTDFSGRFYFSKFDLFKETEEVPTFKTTHKKIVPGVFSEGNSYFYSTHPKLKTLNGKTINSKIFPEITGTVLLVLFRNGVLGLAPAFPTTHSNPIIRDEALRLNQINNTNHHSSMHWTIEKTAFEKFGFSAGMEIIAVGTAIIDEKKVLLITDNSESFKPNIHSIPRLYRALTKVTGLSINMDSFTLFSSFTSDKIKRTIQRYTGIKIDFPLEKKEKRVRVGKALSVAYRYFNFSFIRANLETIMRLSSQLFPNNFEGGYHFNGKNFDFSSVIKTGHPQGTYQFKDLFKLLEKYYHPQIPIEFYLLKEYMGFDLDKFFKSDGFLDEEIIKIYYERADQINQSLELFKQFLEKEFEKKQNKNNKMKTFLKTLKKWTC